jgi:hypothetical protein
MGVLGGLGGVLWLLPTGAAMLAGPNSQHAQGAPLHTPPPFTLGLFSAETAPMSVKDRFRIARGRSATLAGDWGAFSITVSAGRARGGRLPPRRSGRLGALSTYQIGAALRATLPGRLILAGSGTLTYVSGRLGLPGFDGRERHDVIASADVSIARGPNDRLSFSYVDVGSRAGRATLARSIELVAGAPRTASGFRLAFMHRIEGAGPHSLAWGIDLSATRLSQRDSPALLGDPGRAMDRRIAINLDRRF